MQLSMPEQYQASWNVTEIPQSLSYLRNDGVRCSSHLSGTIFSQQVGCRIGCAKAARDGLRNRHVIPRLISDGGATSPPAAKMAH